MLVLEAGHSGDGYTVTPRTGEWRVTIRGVRRYEEHDDNLIDTLLGDAMSASETILVIPNVIDQSAREIQRHIDELPNVTTLYINARLNSEHLVDFLQQSNPEVDVRL